MYPARMPDVNCRYRQVFTVNLARNSLVTKHRLSMCAVQSVLSCAFQGRATVPSLLLRPGSVDYVVPVTN